MSTPTDTATPTTTAEAATAPDAPQQPSADPGAPYGRTPSGRPRRTPLTGKRGRPRGSGNRRPATPRTSTIGAAGATRNTKRGPTDYRPGIMRLTALVTMPLAMRLPVDAATISAHMAGDAQNPGLARAISNLAAEQPQVAAGLDRLMAVGPYTEVGAGVALLAVQLLTNHRKIPLRVAEQMGAVDPDLIAAQLEAEGAQLAAAG